jgi:hypothetical protein
MRQLFCLLGGRRRLRAADRSALQRLPQHRLLARCSTGALIRTLRRLLPEPLPRRGALIQEVLRSRQMSKPPLPAELRRRLVALYRSDILALQDLIGRDLRRSLA